MKKVLALVAAVMLLGGTAMAQASFGVGYMNPNYKNASDGKTMTGVYGGLDYNIHFTDNFGIAPGIYYSYQFKNSETGFFTVSGKSTLTEHYVGVPINLNYSFKLAPDFAIVLYAGPTLSYGIISSTNIKASGSITGISTNNTVNNYDDQNYKPLDVLVGGGVAFDWAETFRVSVGYNYGILDRNASDHHSFNRSYLHMGVAYLF